MKHHERWGIRHCHHQLSVTVIASCRCLTIRTLLFPFCHATQPPNLSTTAYLYSMTADSGIASVMLQTSPLPQTILGDDDKLQEPGNTGSTTKISRVRPHCFISGQIIIRNIFAKPCCMWRCEKTHRQHCRTQRTLVSNYLEYFPVTGVICHCERNLAKSLR